MHKVMMQCRDRGKDPRGAALWGGGCRPDCECGWNSKKMLKAELQGLILEKDGSTFWKTLYATEGKLKDYLLNELETKATAIKDNKAQYIEHGQELLNGSLLIDGELVTMFLFNTSAQEDREIQEAFDDLMRH